MSEPDHCVCLWQGSDEGLELQLSVLSEPDHCVCVCGSDQMKDWSYNLVF